MISEKAEKVLDVIRRQGGGAIDEFIILRKAELSHGSFCAARKELMDAGVLSVSKEGRKTVYIINDKEAVKTDTDTSAAAPPPASRPPARRQPKAMASVSVSRMPRVTGEFADIDEWEDSLISKIGGCVDINQLDETHYEVKAYDLDESARYTVIDDGECITVR